VLPRVILPIFPALASGWQVIFPLSSRSFRRFLLVVSSRDFPKVNALAANGMAIFLNTGIIKKRGAEAPRLQMLFCYRLINPSD
jgi:hypothetical protein